MNTLPTEPIARSSSPPSRPTTPPRPPPLRLPALIPAVEFDEFRNGRLPALQQNRQFMFEPRLIGNVITAWEIVEIVDWMSEVAYVDTSWIGWTAIAATETRHFMLMPRIIGNIINATNHWEHNNNNYLIGRLLILFSHTVLIYVWDIPHVDSIA